MFEEPAFLVQAGHLGKNRIYSSIDNDHLDGAVLSPSDETPDTNQDIESRLSDNDKLVLFDPHVYLPGQGDRPDLDEYDYHDEFLGEDYFSGIFQSKNNRVEFCELVIDAQDTLNVDAYISPAIHMDKLSNDQLDDWTDLTESFIKTARREGRDIPIFASLPVDGPQLNDRDQKNYLLNSATGLNPNGFYVSVMFEDRDIRLPLKGKENIESYLDLFMSLNMNRFETIAAHTHQIAHLLYAVGVDAVASGHYKNLRTFDTDRWISKEDEIRRTVIRYYSDSLLESIRPDNLLNELAENTSFDLDKIREQSPYESGLFDSSTTPATSGWANADAAWEHYLWSMYQIKEKYKEKTLDDRVQEAKDHVSRAEALYRQIDVSADQYTDEVDSEFYSDWSDILEDLSIDEKFQRINMDV